MFSKSLIEVFSSKMSISWSGYDLEHSIINCQKRNIKSTTSEIENNNILFTRFFV
jgi:hypothetical protein